MAGIENRKTKHVFPTETELSEIVRQRTGCALEKIRQEESGLMGMTEKRTKRAAGQAAGNKTGRADGKKEKRGGRRFRMPAAAIAGVCILAASSVSAAAALHYYWGRGMNGQLQASEEQQRKLVEQGIAKVYETQQGSKAQDGWKASAEDAVSDVPAVTCDGVTIAPETVVADEKFAYLSFRISGFQAEAWEVVSAGLPEIYLADDPDGENSWVNMSGHIYTGITADEEGDLVYDDGTPVAYDEEGRTLNRYTDENGDMSFVVQASIGGRGGSQDSLLGRTLHLGFQDVKAVEYTTDAAGRHKPVIQSWTSGKWEFDVPLPDVSAAKHIAVGAPVEGTAFTVESIDLSPISVRVNYEVDGAPEAEQDENGVPTVRSLILRDGTRLPDMAGAGGKGYLDSVKSRAWDMTGFDRVVDVDEVAGLILSVLDGGNEYRTADVMLPQ